VKVHRPRLIKPEEAKATVPCAVNIDKETVVMPRGAPRTRKAVSNLGFNVIDIDFSVHAMAAGRHTLCDWCDLPGD
jgi:hypothetical protein